MEKRGYFKVDRNIFDNELFLHPQKFRLFMYLLGNARYKDGVRRVGDVTIAQGQYLRSFRLVRDDLEFSHYGGLKKMSLSYIKKLVDKLVHEGRIAVERTELGTLFTICNYLEYQVTEFESPQRERERERKENGKRTEREQYSKKDKQDKQDKKDKNVLYSPVVSYLNEKAGTNYRSTTNKTKSLIDARANEGFKLEDFKTVIDKKTNEWIGTKYEKYLRPSTLFGGKFEGYLNQKTNKSKDSWDNVFVEMMGEEEDD